MKWGTLRLELPQAQAERLLAELGSSCIGAESSSAGVGNERLTLYFQSREQAEAGAALARTLPGLRADALQVSALADGRWVERYQASLQPFDIGERFTVDPTGAAAAAGPRQLLRLVPGQAFGTGEHPTTRLCVAALERTVATGSRWLDLGCGSGILSIVAAHCGAAEVLGVDNDPLAVEVAGEVIARNGVVEQVRVVLDADEPADAGWDGVVVNISTPYLVSEAAALAGRLPRGILLASGFPVDDAADVAQAIESHGFTELERGRLEGWGLLVARSGER